MKSPEPNIPKLWPKNTQQQNMFFLSLQHLPQLLSAQIFAYSQPLDSNPTPPPPPAFHMWSVLWPGAGNGCHGQCKGWKCEGCLKRCGCSFWGVARRKDSSKKSRVKSFFLKDEYHKAEVGHFCSARKVHSCKFLMVSFSSQAAGGSTVLYRLLKPPTKISGAAHHCLGGAAKEGGLSGVVSGDVRIPGMGHFPMILTM